MKISIITICYNPGKVIQSAIDSVLNQEYKEIEYLIVDGGSTDGTTNYIKEVGAKDPRVKIVSEPDEGLYDALNKGVQLATGDVVGFVHADDFLADKDVLMRIAESFEHDGVEAVYGDLQYVAELQISRQRLKTENSAGGDEDQGALAYKVIRQWNSGGYSRANLKWGWMPPHPALYLRKVVYRRATLANGEFFDTSYSCAADYDFILRILTGLGVVPVYLPGVIVKMRVGGVSNRSLKHIIRKSAEDWRAIRGNRIGHVYTLLWKNLRKLNQFRYCRHQKL